MTTAEAPRVAHKTSDCLPDSADALGSDGAYPDECGEPRPIEIRHQLTAAGDASDDVGEGLVAELADEVAGEVEEGTRSLRDGSEYIFFGGYWVRHYAHPDDSWAGRKRLIDSLTRRAFHHTEPGINTPGRRLDEARCAYEEQTDPAMKRVNAAMLAGALFNRATDLFTRIVELEEQGVSLSGDNELMQSCGDCFQEALELGKQVKHHSGEEGIDELWGEPFRVFTLPLDKYFESRYIKISQTMANIDFIARLLLDTLGDREEFADLEQLVSSFACAARKESETMKSDSCHFDIWPRFVATGEALEQFKPKPTEGCSRECVYVMEHAYQTLVAGRDLIKWIAQARVPMPESTRAFVKRCEALKMELENC